MSFLDGLLGSPNVSQATNSSVSAATGASLFLTAPSVVRTKSGQFKLSSSVCANLAGSTSGGISIQFFSSLTGAIGPTATGVGVNGSSAASIVWIDSPSINVGQSITYSVEVSPTNASTSITLPNKASSIVVAEEGGAPSGSGVIAVSTSGGGGGGGGGALSSLASPFTMPAVGSTVIAAMIPGGGAAFQKNNAVNVDVSGAPSNFTVTLVSGDNVTLLNNGGPFNVAPTGTVPAASIVTVASMNAPISATAPATGQVPLLAATGQYTPAGVSTRYNVQSYGGGAKCDLQVSGDFWSGGSYAVMTSGSPVLTLTASTPFVAGDVGKHITVLGAGVNGSDLHTTIQTFTNSGQVSLAANAGTSVGANDQRPFYWGTDDSTAVAATITAAQGAIFGGAYYPHGGNTVYFPAPCYLVSSQTFNSSTEFDCAKGAFVHCEAGLNIYSSIRTHHGQQIFSPATVVQLADPAHSFNPTLQHNVYLGWWGARGDWSGGSNGTDNTRACRSALASCASYNQSLLQLGGKLMLGRGRFRVADVPFTIDQNGSGIANWTASLGVVAGTTHVGATLIQPPGGSTNGMYYGCISGGTTGLSAPVFSAVIGSVTSDNGVLWRCLGPVSQYTMEGVTIEGERCPSGGGANNDTIIVCDWAEPATGTAASLSNAGVLSGLSGMNASHVGCFVYLTVGTTATNRGFWHIASVTNGTTVQLDDYSFGGGIGGAAPWTTDNSGTIAWTVTTVGKTPIRVWTRDNTVKNLALVGAPGRILMAATEDTTPPLTGVSSDNTFEHVVMSFQGAVVWCMGHHKGDDPIQASTLANQIANGDGENDLFRRCNYDCASMFGFYDPDGGGQHKDTLICEGTTLGGNNAINPRAALSIGSGHFWLDNVSLGQAYIGIMPRACTPVGGRNLSSEGLSRLFWYQNAPGSTIFNLSISGWRCSAAAMAADNIIGTFVGAGALTLNNLQLDSAPNGNTLHFKIGNGTNAPANLVAFGSEFPSQPAVTGELGNYLTTLINCTSVDGSGNGVSIPYTRAGSGQGFAASTKPSQIEWPPGVVETVSSATPTAILAITTVTGSGGLLRIRCISRASTTGAGIAVNDTATSTYEVAFKNNAGTVALDTTGITVQGTTRTTAAALTAPVLTATVATNVITILVTNVNLCTVESTAVAVEVQG